MGLTYTEICLANARKKETKSVAVQALADTGALHLCIPEYLAMQLKLEELEKRQVTTADGKKKTYPYVGPVELKFKNRTCYVGAMVMGDEVLLGAIPMEDMDLVVHPQEQKVMINPGDLGIPSTARI